MAKTKYETAATRYWMQYTLMVELFSGSATRQRKYMQKMMTRWQPAKMANRTELNKVSSMCCDIRITKKMLTQYLLQKLDRNI